MKVNGNRKLPIKQADSFLKRFEGRYEKLGSGGIKEVTLKNSIEGQLLFKNMNENKDNPNPLNERKKNQQMFSRMMNQYNILTMEDYKRIPKKKVNFNIIEDNKYQSSNNIVNNNANNNNIDNNNFDINDNEINNINNEINNNSKNILKNPNNKKILNYNNNYINHEKNIEKNITPTISPKLNHNNSFPTYESTNSNNNYSYNYSDDFEQKPNVIEHERFYKPYSLKQYKNIMENYRQDKFGGLGKNMNKDWKERERKINKVKKFENSIVKNFNKKVNDFNYKRVESPQKMELIKIGKQIMNSKRFIAQKYGKGVMLNKVRRQRKNDKIEMDKIRQFEEQEKYLRHREYERKQKDEDMIKIYDNVINEKRNNYIDKLNQLKSSLI